MLQEYIQLFLLSLAAGSILPVPSEFYLLYLKNFYPSMEIVLIATIGNTTGAVLNYYVGFKGLHSIIKKLYGTSDIRIKHYTNVLGKYGVILSFFSFLPFVGDMFTLAAGLIRANFYLFLVSVFIGKYLRYAVIMELV